MKIRIFIVFITMTFCSHPLVAMDALLRKQKQVADAQLEMANKNMQDPIEANFKQWEQAATKRWGGYPSYVWHAIWDQARQIMEPLHNTIKATWSNPELENSPAIQKLKEQRSHYARRIFDLMPSDLDPDDSIVRNALDNFGYYAEQEAINAGRRMQWNEESVKKEVADKFELAKKKMPSTIVSPEAIWNYFANFAIGDIQSKKTITKQIVGYTRKDKALIKEYASQAMENYQDSFSKENKELYEKLVKMNESGFPL